MKSYKEYVEHSTILKYLIFILIFFIELDQN